MYVTNCWWQRWDIGLSRYSPPATFTSNSLLLADIYFSKFSYNFTTHISFKKKKKLQFFPKFQI